MTQISTATDLQQRLARWENFQGPQPRDPFVFYVNWQDSDDRLEFAPTPPLWRDNQDARIESAWKNYQVMCRRAEIVADDRVPYLNNLTGTEIFAEAFGCQVHYPDDNNPFALACVHTAADASKLQVPELSTSRLAYLFDIADELQRRAGRDALQRLVDIQSPMDIAALIWEKSAFFMAMFDAPQAVRDLAGKVRRLLEAFLDEWFERYGTTYVAHFPDYLMFGGMTLSEDEIGQVNAEMFNEFFRDELVALSERYGGIGIHCCAEAYHQWANLRDLPGLKVLNLCTPPTQDYSYIERAFPFFGNRILHAHNSEPSREKFFDWIRRNVVHGRLFFHAQADSRDEAVRLADELNDLREELRSR